MFVPVLAKSPLKYSRVIPKTFMFFLTQDAEVRQVENIRTHPFPSSSQHLLLYKLNKNVDQLDMNLLYAVGITKMGNPDLDITQGGKFSPIFA